MTHERRLKLTAIVSLLGIVGLSALLFYALPKEAREFLRRDSEKRLEAAAERLPEMLLENAEQSLRALQKLKSQPRTTELFERTAQDDAASLAGSVSLAKSLAAQHGLSSLLFLDKTGKLLSLHPNEAMIGFQKPDLLEVAKAAPKTPIFSHALEKLLSKKYKPAADAIGAEMCLSAKANYGGFLFSCTPLTKQAIDIAAMQLGVSVVKIADASETPALSEKAKSVGINSPGGQRLFSVVIEPAGQGGQIVERLIQRTILLYAAPFSLLFFILLLLLAWPKRR